MSEKMQAKEFSAYYTVLCAHVADAIEALERRDYGTAQETLISGMRDAEDLILSQAE